MAQFPTLASKICKNKSQDLKFSHSRRKTKQNQKSQGMSQALVTPLRRVVASENSWMVVGNMRWYREKKLYWSSPVWTGEGRGQTALQWLTLWWSVWCWIAEKSIGSKFQGLQGRWEKKLDTDLHAQDRGAELDEMLVCFSYSLFLIWCFWLGEQSPFWWVYFLYFFFF